MYGHEKQCDCAVCDDVRFRETLKRFPYTFPRSNFVDKNTDSDQVSHIASEIKEWFEAGADDELGELLDIYHSIETRLRILTEKHGIDIYQAARQTEEKNRVRGYYD